MGMGWEHVNSLAPASAFTEHEERIQHVNNSVVFNEVKPLI